MMINVLSLFDGISCGHVALERANIEVNNYYASEIDKHAMMVTQHNFPSTIQIGSVTEVSYKDGILYTENGEFNVGRIDLVMGGSPCQDLSRSKTDGEGLDGDRSGLFYDFVRIVKEVNPKYFLLENVIMKQEWKDIITEEMGVEPIEINSNLVSAQSRRRLYWTNIPNVDQPEDKGIFIKDVIYDNEYKIFTDQRITNTKKLTKNYVKWDMSGKQYWSQQDRAYYLDGKMCTLPKANPANKMNICLDYENDVYRRCHPVEAERFQTLPDHYTEVEGLSSNKRLEGIGNGWTVDVIAHIFKNMI